MDNIIIRPGRPEDAKDFARLVMLTAPEYFDVILGDGAPAILAGLFQNPGNIFSCTHSYFMEVNDEVAGMTLFYDHDCKEREIAPFVLLLMRFLKFKFFVRLRALMKFGSIFARTRKGDMYSSNSALYPKFRGRGLGQRIFSLSEERAREAGLKRVVVDVKADNVAAISLREKLGYRIDERLPILKIGDKTFEYVKLVKVIG